MAMANQTMEAMNTLLKPRELHPSFKCSSINETQCIRKVASAMIIGHKKGKEMWIYTQRYGQVLIEKMRF